MCLSLSHVCDARGDRHRHGGWWSSTACANWPSRNDEHAPLPRRPLPPVRAASSRKAIWTCLRGGGVAGVAGGASAAAIYGAASGHTSATTTAPPCNEPGTDPRGAHEPRLRDAHALDVTLDSLKLMAAATVAARQPAAVQSVLSTLGLTLMPDLLADPLFNVSSAPGLVLISSLRVAPSLTLCVCSCVER